MPPAVGIGDLFDGLGTLDLAYSRRAAALDGHRITIEGFLAPDNGRPDRFLLVDTPGACPDCAGIPVPAVTLPEVRELPVGVVVGRTRVSVDGRLSFGFQVDDEDDASFLRLEEAHLRRGRSRGEIALGGRVGIR